MGKSWTNLENYARAIASIMWIKEAIPERIDGVNFDGVIRISDEEIVLIEVTEEHNLAKIRGDIAKISAIKMRFASEMIVARAYIILKNEPTPGMVDLGKSNKISVLSVANFSKQAFNFAGYETLRSKIAFGSSINPATGESDQHEYIPVHYTDTEKGKEFSVAEIVGKLRNNEKILLLGDYGTGKSRCVREAFHELAKDVSISSAFVFAINLREHWGAGSAVEIISGHLKRLGLSTSIDRAMQLLNSGHIILLLDGFDEVGTQTFGTNQNKRITVRREALQGIRELIAMNPAGLLITGRPHYFNSVVEMNECLGFSSKKSGVLSLKCADEFNDAQAQAYLGKINVNAKVPSWLPKKPLMFLVLAAIDAADAERILASKSGEVGFWGQFIDTVCEREAKIHSSIDPASVRLVLTNLARVTRQSDRPLGRLTPKDVTHAYELATGFVPDESGQLMLSRLCTLGRIEPESPDRQFVDPYIVQLLFADCLVDDISNKNFSILDQKWRQALQPMGLYFLAQWMEIYGSSADAISMIQRDSTPVNSQAVGELAAALTMFENDTIDYHGVSIKDAEICQIEFGLNNFINLSFSECQFGSVSFVNCKITAESHVRIENSSMAMAVGLTSIDALPVWVNSTSIDATESVSNSSRIKSSSLPSSQKLFLSVIHKIFFQHGGGRKESSLYKGGFGQQFDRKLIEDILSILVNQKFVEKSKDGSVFIYNPKREYTARMKAIKDQLTLSVDPLWLLMADLK
jgi:hypothetical protein